MAISKRLIKSRANRMLFGVAGGIAEYFDIDPVLVRVGFVVLMFLSGAGLIAYIILAIVMPEPAGTVPPPGETISPSATSPEGLPASDRPSPTPSVPPEVRRSVPFILGAILIGLGVLFLLQNLGLALWWFRWDVFWPLVLIGIGLLVLVATMRRRA